MPIRRSAALAVAAVLLALSSRGARGCPIAETEPICALLDERDSAPAGEEPAASSSTELGELRAALAAEPDSSAHVAALAAALDREDQPRAARRLLERHLVDHPRALDVLHALLELEWTSDRTARAHELALTWRALAPRDPRAILHELVTAATVESEPDVEGRLAELARASDDAALGFAACSSLTPPRTGRCVTRLVDLYDWTRADPELWRRLFLLLHWQGEPAQEWALFDRQKDAALREFAALLLATDASWSGDCSTALGLVTVLSASPERRAIEERCRPRRTPRDEFLAELASGDIGRAYQASWPLGGNRDPELERAVRARLDRDATDRRLWRMLAHFADQGSGADAVWAEWAAAQPENFEPMSRMASERFLRGEVEEGLEALRAALGRTRGEERASLEEQWLQNAQLERNAAISALLVEEIAPVDDASSRRATLARAILAQAEERPSDALALVRSVRPSENDYVTETLESELLVAIGDEAAWLERVERESPGIPRDERDAWIADLARGEGFSRLARERYALALAEDPGDPELWRSLGQLELDAERTAAAIDALRRAVALQPEHPWSRSLLADALVAEERWSEALDVLAGHAGAETFLADGLLELAIAARSAGQPYVADDALDRAATIEPEAPDVLFALAERSAREGLRDEARQQFAAFVRRYGQFSNCVTDCDLPSLERRARDFLATGELARLEIE